MTNSSQIFFRNLSATDQYDISCSNSLDISFFIFARQNPSFAYILLAISSVMCSLTAVVGNTIVIIALWRSKSMYSATKALFYSLALSDLATGLTQPLFVAYLLGVAWENGWLYCTVALPFSLTALFFSMVSLWTLSIIAVIDISLFISTRDTRQWLLSNLLLLLYFWAGSSVPFVRSP